MIGRPDADIGNSAAAADMSTAVEGIVGHDSMLFSGGPMHSFESLLLRSGQRRVGRRALLTVLVGWLPLALLTAMRGDFIRSDAQNSFLLDFGVHARFLVAAPLLLLAEAVCVPRLAAIARLFIDTGLIAGSERIHYDTAVDSSRRLMNSRVVGVACIVLVYALILGLVQATSPDLIASWHGRLNPFAPSPAGWWGLLVSLPLLLLLLLGWLWRICVWTRFLWLINRMPLQLEAAHPDKAGGLGFVGTSVEALLPIGFVVGVICAGPVADQVVHHDAHPAEFESVAIGAAVAATVLCAGPLLIFLRRLVEERNRAIGRYGALALSMDKRFRLRWLGSGPPMDQGTVDMSEFTGTNAANSIVANAIGVGILPLHLRSVGLLIVTTLLPFVPVWLSAVPFKELAGKLGGFLL